MPTLHRFFKPFSSALQTLVEPLSKDQSRPSNDLIWVERRFLKFLKLQYEIEQYPNLQFY